MGKKRPSKGLQKQTSVTELIHAWENKVSTEDSEKSQTTSGSNTFIEDEGNLHAVEYHVPRNSDSPTIAVSVDGNEDAGFATQPTIVISDSEQDATRVRRRRDSMRASLALCSSDDESSEGADLSEYVSGQPVQFFEPTNQAAPIIMISVDNKPDAKGALVPSIVVSEHKTPAGSVQCDSDDDTEKQVLITNTSDISDGSSGGGGGVVFSTSTSVPAILVSFDQDRKKSGSGPSGVPSIVVSEYHAKTTPSASPRRDQKKGASSSGTSAFAAADRDAPVSSSGDSNSGTPTGHGPAVFNKRIRTRSSSQDNASNQRVQRIVSSFNATEKAVQSVLKDAPDNWFTACRTTQGGTALHHAAQQVASQAVRTLLNRKDVRCYMNATDNKGQTALHYACHPTRRRDPTEIINMIIEAGGDLEARDLKHETPLHKACAVGNVDVVEILVENGADINAANKRQATPLHVAAGAGRVDIMKILVRNGVSLQEPMKGNNNAVHISALHGREDALRYLLDRGVSAETTTSTGQTPLHHAVRGESVECIRHLLEAGASALRRDVNGVTPLELAAAKGLPSMARVLCDHIIKFSVNGVYDDTTAEVAAAAAGTVPPTPDVSLDMGYSGIHSPGSTRGPQSRYVADLSAAQNATAHPDTNRMRFALLPSSSFIGNNAAELATREELLEETKRLSAQNRRLEEMFADLKNSGNYDLALRLRATESLLDKVTNERVETLESEGRLKDEEIKHLKRRLGDLRHRVDDAYEMNKALGKRSAGRGAAASSPIRVPPPGPVKTDKLNYSSMSFWPDEPKMDPMEIRDQAEKTGDQFLADKQELLDVLTNVQVHVRQHHHETELATDLMDLNYKFRKFMDETTVGFLNSQAAWSCYDKLLQEVRTLKTLYSD
eukprot:GFYU01009600.1.p1 GENE.GFYU01009600.1~~GFYU01009600.1.p1  ORF type:complete len:893 (-),score=223.03 GFYU01009600.1:47-2725(-)